MFGGPSGRPDPFRSLYYQPGRGQSFVLAAHITGEPRDRLAGSPINVVLVADVETVCDTFFEMREQGTSTGPGHRLEFRQRHLPAQCPGLAGRRRRQPAGASQAPSQHRTLERFDDRTREARKENAQAMEKLRKDHDEGIRNTEKEGEEEVKKRAQELQEAAISTNRPS